MIGDFAYLRGLYVFARSTTMGNAKASNRRMGAWCEPTFLILDRLQNLPIIILIMKNFYRKACRCGLFLVASAMVALSARADVGMDQLVFTINEDGQGYSVAATDKEIEGSLLIPAEYNGLPVTSVAEQGFFQCKNLSRVEIPSSVTLLGNYSFTGCENLAEVIIPESVTDLGESAFSMCYALESVKIPQSITVIKPNTFDFLRKTERNRDTEFSYKNRQICVCLLSSTGNYNTW